MTRPVLALSLLLASVAAPVLAQEQWPTEMRPESAVARLVEAAMPNSEYDWSRDWSPFGVRLGHAGVRWHLHEPRPYERTPLPPGVHHRVGWSSVNGRTIEISVYGDEQRVDEMSLEIAGLWLGEIDLAQELQTLDVTATPPAVPQQQSLAPPPDRNADDYYLSLFNRYPGRQSWRLEKSGRDPVRLDARWNCTPPGTRSATRCEMTWTLWLEPDSAAAGQS